MSNRITFHKVYPAGYKTLLEFSKAVNQSGLDEHTQELIKLRSSQINSCVFCLDNHLTAARKLGFTDQQLMTLSAWDESPFFTDEQKTVLALTDAMTSIADGGVPDEVYDDALELLGEEGLAKAMMTICLINTWNRLMAATQAVPASYKP